MPETTKRILVCDDHDVFRKHLVSLLTRLGFVVVAECADGAEAVAQSQQTLPALAILDLTMPNMNGIEATRAIRRISPKTHCILLSVHTDAAKSLAAMRAGAEAYVVKSRGLEDLMLAIQAVQQGQLFVSPSVED